MNEFIHKFSPKKLLFYLICTGIVLMINPKMAFATDIRGRVEALSSYSNNIQPLRGIKVEIVRCNLRCRVQDYTYTSSRGFYYFRNIRPGVYTIRINNDQDARIEIYDQRFQDIPPIRIR